MRKIRHKIMRSIIKTLKFIWRNAFILFFFGLLIKAFIDGPVCWKKCLYVYVGAALLDMIKMRFRQQSTNTASSAYTIATNYGKNELNPSNFGSCAWMSNPTQIGSPAYNLNNLGPRNTYDR